MISGDVQCPVAPDFLYSTDKNVILPVIFPALTVLHKPVFREAMNMYEIKCPKCGEVFRVEKAAYFRVYDS